MFTLLVGGARSGKSALAERIGRAHAGPVTYIATCPRIDGDTELDERIDRHRRDRPEQWVTIEEQVELAAAIAGVGEPLLIVDCLTTWVGNLLHHGCTEVEVLEAADAACSVTRRRTSPSIVISNDVGSGIIPADAVSRHYRDLLGRVNQRWAAAAERSLLVIAGRVVELVDPFELP